MYVNQVFELSMTLDQEHFCEILEAAYSKSDGWKEEGREYIDHTLSSKGITVKYRDSRYKKKVKLVVNAGKLCGSVTVDPDKLAQKLEKQISKYFDGKYTADDFTLSKMSIMTNIDLGDQYKVSPYIKLFHRIGKVKGYSPAVNDDLAPSISFSLSGNSNGVHVSIYNLQEAIKNHLKGLDDVPKEANELSDDAAGILRIEIGLQSKAIRACSDEILATDQIRFLCKNSVEIFLGILTQIIPIGDSYKKADVLDVLHREVSDKILQRKMIRLVVLIPEKKSLLLAQKAANFRRINEVMDTFARINLSPITIGKRQNIDHLTSIYSYLL